VSPPTPFVDAFDEIFRTEGFKILKTPGRTPVVNAFAERWIGTLRRELLDRTLIWNRHQLERLVADYLEHYNLHRPHRSLGQRPPAGGPAHPRTAFTESTLRGAGREAIEYHVGERPGHLSVRFRGTLR